MSPIIVSQAEYELLEKLAGLEPGRYTTRELAERLGVDRSRLEALVRLLASKGVIGVEDRVREDLVVTEEGLAYLRGRFPEEELVELLRERGGSVSVEEARRLLGKRFGIAMSNAARKGWVRVREGRIELLGGGVCEEERRALQEILAGGRPGGDVVRLLRRRGLVRVVRRRETLVEVPRSLSDVLREVRVEVGALTHEDLATGRWRRLRLRPYNVAAAPPRRLPGRKHFFAEFLYRIRDVLRELGFRELEGWSIVVTEFWNYDILFQPQFHPARFPTDTFYVSTKATGIDADEDLVERVRRAHEEGITGSIGWGYKWSREKASMRILRSHTTAVTIRALAELKPRPPFRYYVLGRVYRVEKPDPRHLVEFHQFDGIMSEDNTSFSSLLGMIAEIFERLGIKEYRFRPAYFPFTEPSAEVYAKVAGTWIEVGGCGMFRPEVLASAGYSGGEVAAWGIGVERLMASLYGLRDIRDLYTLDVDKARSTPLRWWIYAGVEV